MRPMLVARADQIMAVLRDAEGPLSTYEVAKRSGTGSNTYMALVRLDRGGDAIKLRHPGDRSVYWRASAVARREAAAMAKLVEEMAPAD